MPERSGELTSNTLIFNPLAVKDKVMASWSGSSGVMTQVPVNRHMLPSVGIEARGKNVLYKRRISNLLLMKPETQSCAS